MDSSREVAVERRAKSAKMKQKRGQIQCVSAYAEFVTKRLQHMANGLFNLPKHPKQHADGLGTVRVSHIAPYYALFSPESMKQRQWRLKAARNSKLGESTATPLSSLHCLQSAGPRKRRLLLIILQLNDKLILNKSHHTAHAQSHPLRRIISHSPANITSTTLWTHPWSRGRFR